MKWGRARWSPTSGPWRGGKRAAGPARVHAPVSWGVRGWEEEEAPWLPPGIPAAPRVADRCIRWVPRGTPWWPLRGAGLPDGVGVGWGTVCCPLHPAVLPLGSALCCSRQIGAPGQGRWAGLPGAGAPTPQLLLRPLPAVASLGAARPPVPVRVSASCLVTRAEGRGPAVSALSPGAVLMASAVKGPRPHRGPCWLEKAAGSRPGDWEGLATRGPQGGDSVVSGPPSSARMCTWTATLHSPRAPFLRLSSACRRLPAGPCHPGAGRSVVSGGRPVPGQPEAWRWSGGAGTCEEVRPGGASGDWGVVAFPAGVRLPGAEGEGCFQGVLGTLRSGSSLGWGLQWFPGGPPAPLPAPSQAHLPAVPPLLTFAP